MPGRPRSLQWEGCAVLVAVLDRPQGRVALNAAAYGWPVPAGTVQIRKGADLMERDCLEFVSYPTKATCRHWVEWPVDRRGQARIR